MITTMTRLTKKQKQLLITAQNNRREIIAAQLTRREMLQMGLLTSAGMLVAKSGLSARATLPTVAMQNKALSPPTTPFTEPLTISPVKKPVLTLSPTPTAVPNRARGEGRIATHQRFNEFAPRRLYEMHERQVQVSMHRDLPLQTVWGFDGLLPGPTFHSRYGESALVRIFNDLPPLGQRQVGGFGRPETSTHLHNGHTPTSSDGFPDDFFGTGLFYDHHYPNIRAGYDANPPQGDLAETLGTLWYHDHRADFTAQNVYKGLAGFHLLFDEFDTGNETDPAPAFGLPSQNFDVPLMLSERVFDQAGQVFFDLFNVDGILGDKFLVNGKMQPFFQVHPRKYRFRILDVSPSRYYRLFLTDPKNLAKVNPFVVIGNDGNLLPAPLQLESFMLTSAERMDVVIDFSKFAPGTQLYLENRLLQQDGRGPTDNLTNPGGGNLLMRFDVVLPRVPDFSRIPATLRPLPSRTPARVDATREWTFKRHSGMWSINNIFYDVNTVRAAPKKGSTEIWTLKNDSGGWSHPIHIHFEEFQILSRNGLPPAPIEAGRKDIAHLAPNTELKILLRFRDFVGRYVMHCHNVLHEDHAMMLRWDIQP